MNVVAPSPHTCVTWLDAAQWPLLAAVGQRLGFAVTATDLAGRRTAQEVLQHLGPALALPEWYGANFDALADCLGDPDWQPAPGHIVMLGGTRTFRSAAPEDWRTLIDVLETVAASRADDGKPFWIVLDSPDTGLPPFIIA